MYPPLVDEIFYLTYSLTAFRSLYPPGLGYSYPRASSQGTRHESRSSAQLRGSQLQTESSS